MLTLINLGRERGKVLGEMNCASLDNNNNKKNTKNAIGMRK